MHKISSLLISLAALSLVACSEVPVQAHAPVIPDGSHVGVFMLRDCTVPKQPDCAGSGAIAGKILLQTLGGRVFKIVPLERGIAPDRDLSDRLALAIGRQQGLDYVLNGEMQDFHRVAPMTFRPERAALTVRLLRVSDGQVVYSHTDQGSKNNFSSPEKIVANIAGDVRDQLEGRR